MTETRKTRRHRSPLPWATLLCFLVAGPVPAGQPDGSPDQTVLSRIRGAIEADADNRVADLHVWRLGPRDYGAIISIVTHQPRDPEHYKGLLHEVDHLTHLTVEVNRCRDEACAAHG